MCSLTACDASAISMPVGGAAALAGCSTCKGSEPLQKQSTWMHVTLELLGGCGTRPTSTDTPMTHSTNTAQGPASKAAPGLCASSLLPHLVFCIVTANLGAGRAA